MIFLVQKQRERDGGAVAAVAVINDTILGLYTNVPKVYELFHCSKNRFAVTPMLWLCVRALTRAI